MEELTGFTYNKDEKEWVFNVADDLRIKKLGDENYRVHFTRGPSTDVVDYKIRNIRTLGQAELIAMGWYFKYLRPKLIAPAGAVLSGRDSEIKCESKVMNREDLITVYQE